VVEVLHFTGGEIIPRRVLCPWRAHLLASTLPAVAQATAACSMRCAWMVGRGLGLLVYSERLGASTLEHTLMAPAQSPQWDQGVSTA